MNKIIEHLLELVQTYTNGFAVTIPTPMPVVDGWIVPRIETLNCIGMEGLRRVLKFISTTPGIVGGWEDGEFHWYAAEIYHDQAEAIQAGRENGQSVIINLTTQQVKYLK